MTEIVKYLEEIKEHQMQTVQLARTTEVYKLADKALKAINVIQCCETLKDEGQATLTEYATELINIQENPQDSNKDWKIVVMQNTIGKLHETIKSL